MSVAALSLEQFKNRFYQEKCPWWFAYDTGPKKTCRGRYKDHDPNMTEEEVLDWSWIQFEELVSNITYGKLEVVCKSSEQANKGNSPTYTVEWGDASSAPVVIPGGRGRTVQQQPAMGGNWQMMQMMMQMQQNMQNEVNKAQLDAQQARFESQLLAMQLESENSPSMQEELLKEGIGALKTIVPQLINKQPAQLGTLGQRNDTTEQADRGGGNQHRELTPDVAHKYMTAIAGLFPEWDAYTVLDALYNLGLQNKDMMRPMLQKVIAHAKQ